MIPNLQPSLDFGRVPIGRSVTRDWLIDPSTTTGAHAPKLEWAGPTEEFSIESGTRLHSDAEAEGTVVPVTFRPRRLGRSCGEVLIRDANAQNTILDRFRVEGVGHQPTRLAYLETSASRRDEGAREGRHYFVCVGQDGYLNACAEALVLEGADTKNLSLIAAPSGTRRGTVTSGYAPRAGEILLSPEETFTGGPAAVSCFEVQMVDPAWLTRHHTVIDDNIRFTSALTHAIGRERAFIHPHPACEHCLVGPVDPQIPPQGAVFEDRNKRLSVVVSPPKVTEYLMLEYDHFLPSLVVYAVATGPGARSTWSAVVTQLGAFGSIALLPWTIRMSPLRGQYYVGRVGAQSMRDLLELCATVLDL